MDDKHIIINVGRQLGAGGRTIAKGLAETFGCTFYDKELLNLAAKESGFSEKFFEQNDEQKGFFRSLFHLHASHVGDNNFYGNGISQESLFKFQSDAIRKAAAQGPCVFVGRCADYILRDFPNVVNIFITAQEDFRVEQVCKRHGFDRETALKHLHNGDSSRASYYNYYTGKKWGHADSYDLCIDASILGINETENFVASFIRKRFNL